MLRLYNTLTRKKQVFKPLRGKTATLYTCGPTVYDYAHIGNMRAYIFSDVLKRTLFLAGFRVRHIMNITDVGHLISDADTGEDKIAKAARAERKTAWQVARFYERAFRSDIKNLNILPPNRWARATEHIKEQIDLIKTLEKKGFTYAIPDDGIYFDTSKFKKYGELMPSRLRGLKAGARIEVVPGKRNLTDFALWKFSPSGVKRDMEWPNPWGKGFPGWHIECSAMSMKYLGQPIDIHTGGVEHIPIHHTNEIAQSEAATGKKFVRFWMHEEFLRVEGGKMAKSKSNFFTLEDIVKRGFDPLDFRYFVLNAHYRTPLNFTWTALEAARKARLSLKEFANSRANKKQTKLQATPSSDVLTKINSALFDDLNTPRALAILWDTVRQANKNPEKSRPRKIALVIKQADRVLGLNLLKKDRALIPAKIARLVAKREKLRAQGKFKEADVIRVKILKSGFELRDTPEGPRVVVE